MDSALSELLSPPGTGPAALEISPAIQSNVDGAGEREVVRQDALNAVALARRERKVELQGALNSITVGISTSNVE